MSNCVVQDFINVVQKLVLVYLYLLCRLHNCNNLCVTLLKPASLRFDLEVAILVAKLDSLIPPPVLY